MTDDRRTRQRNLKAPTEITVLLQAWAGGEEGARDRLVPVVYDELRRRAAAYMRRERPGQTLQPTALVHEVYVRMAQKDRAAWRDRAHFFAVASQMMRRILVDRARARRGAKRSGQWRRVTLAEDAGKASPREIDVLDLDTALDELSAFAPRKAQVAELRFFGGLSLEEVGTVLDTSLATTMRDWQTARAWLYKRLTRDASKRTL